MHGNPLSDLRGDLRLTAGAKLKKHPFDSHLKEAQSLAESYINHVPVYNSTIKVQTDLWLTDPFSQLSVIGHFGRCLQRNGIDSRELPNHPLIKELHRRIDDYAEKTATDPIAHDFSNLIRVANQLAREAHIEREEKLALEKGHPISKDAQKYELFIERETSGFRRFQQLCGTNEQVKQQFEQLLTILPIKDEIKKEFEDQYQETYAGGRQDLFHQ